MTCALVTERMDDSMVVHHVTNLDLTPYNTFIWLDTS